MKGHTLLIVDDDAKAREALRGALEAEGATVIEAPGGDAALRTLETVSPDLAIVSLVLRDCAGLELARRLKEALPRLVVLALAGFLGRKDEASLLAGGVDDVFTRPVQPALLTLAVKTHLAALDEAVERFGLGRSIVVAAANSARLRFTRRQLEQLGFEVYTARDGEAAWRLLQSSAAEALVADTFLPRLDGFELAARVREQAQGGRLPIVLVTSSTNEAEEQRVAARLGVDATISNGSSPKELVVALRAALSRPSDQPAASSAAPRTQQEVMEQRLQRLHQQLEHQTARCAVLFQRYARLSAEHTVLVSAANILARGGVPEEALQGLLVNCLDAIGLLQGGIYTVAPRGGLALKAQAGFDAERTVALPPWVAGLEQLQAVVCSEKVSVASPVSQPEGLTPPVCCCRVTADASVQVLPLQLAGELLGALVLVTTPREEDVDWHYFVEMLGTQLSLVLARFRAFSASQRSEQRCRQLLDNAHYAIFITQEQGLIQEVNPAAQRLFQRSWGELIGRPLAEILPEVESQWERLQGLPPATERGFTSDLRRADGSVVRLETSLSFTHDDQGLLYFVIMQDVTAQRALEEELRQAQKMEAVGQLASGIAHDFNNLLAVITSCAELLAAELAPEDARREDVADIREAAERAASLTRQLLTFSRKDDLTPTLLDVNAVVLRVEGFLRRMLEANVQLTTTLSSSQQLVRANSGQLEQVLINLVINSQDAMPRGGSISIETSEVLIDEARQLANPGLELGAYVRIRVMDDGEGISAEAKQRIFEPFFTTKPAGKGTGLGLSMVYGILRQWKGSISVESAPGAGAAFDLLIPSGAPTGARVTLSQRPSAPAEAVAPPRSNVQSGVEDTP